ncbi:MAG: riboflavin synthase [Candidatus Omnitrophota bacterium]
MFTGIIEEIGRVVRAENKTVGLMLAIKAEKVCQGAGLGDSVAVNGACLTITDIKKDVLSFDVMAETIDKTTLGGLKADDPVNLERAMKADSRMGGHLVAGHVDYRARIIEIINGPKGVSFKVFLPGEFSRLVVDKGSVALDGVSLTVAEASKGYFTVYLIPHTLKATTFGNKRKGDYLNVETDIVGKYIAKQAAKEDNLEDKLKEYGYI